MGTDDGRSAMTEHLKGFQNQSSQLILFCGLPGTLKTYLSVRVSGRLGYGYLPTRSVGEINSSSEAGLKEARQKRYEALAQAALAALRLGASLVVDGGFMTKGSRAPLLNSVNPANTVLVNCLCDNENIRMQRLATRAMDPIDYENQSAQEILQADRAPIRLSSEDAAESELTKGTIGAILNVDTVNATTEWRGRPPQNLCVKLPQIIRELLREYICSQEAHSFNLALKAHFDELADQYESATEWRTNSELLASLQRKLMLKPARVLDIGTGTGLASEWYAKQGHHVVGVDISPMMLRKAAERLTLTVLGDATLLPFLDQYFDLILIRQCLHYVNPRRLLSSAIRTLRPEGSIVVSSAISSESSKTFWQEFKAVTQPLRLAVFTARDIRNFLSETGLAIEEEVHHEIIRREALTSLEKRSASPLGGWKSFLGTVEKIAKSTSPELMFSFKDGVIEYKQYWVTIWTKPANDSRSNAP